MIKIHGDVTTAGMANSSQIETSILPFILRGVTLHGINAEESLNFHSSKIWDKLSNEWKPNSFRNIFQVINLDEPKYLNLYLENKIIGRVVVKHKFKIMDINEISKKLDIYEPFLMIDKIDINSKDKSKSKNFKPGIMVFSMSIPNEQIMPASLIVEGMLQTMALLIYECSIMIMKKHLLLI